MIYMCMVIQTAYLPSNLLVNLPEMLVLLTLLLRLAKLHKDEEGCYRYVIDA